MPFLGKGTKHRRYGQTGPYGPGAGFAIGSGERLAARRRETAQAKAFVRRYPGMRPQAMDTVAGAMFGNGQSAGLMTGFGDVRRGAGFAQFEESGWEDPTATTPYPVSRNQFQSPSAFAPSRGPAFGRQRQSFWPGREFREAILRSQGMRQPIREEDFLEELYSWRQPEDDYLDAYGGLGTRQFPRQFDDYQRGGFSPPHNEPFGDQPYRYFGAGRENAPSSGDLNDQPGRGGRFDAYGAQPCSWRGSPRDSYERLRPEDL